ncbi:hypothetical protein TanjilG_25464 [Lupinus angustifolius]|uniref:Uncharacterized protein n=1 Tax=Lupinus angustifolius TaxID=3871 RepID=A0A4P1QT27_LUPAN|nr:hypothetical protein TanjilG_25464 [Lupinus angustifolius]
MRMLYCFSQRCCNITKDEKSSFNCYFCGAKEKDVGYNMSTFSETCSQIDNSPSLSLGDGSRGSY